MQSRETSSESLDCSNGIRRKDTLDTDGGLVFGVFIAGHAVDERDTSRRSGWTLEVAAAYTGRWQEALYVLNPRRALAELGQSKWDGYDEESNDRGSRLKRRLKKHGGWSGGGWEGSQM